jgi:hypothetical protein
LFAVRHCFDEDHFLLERKNMMKKFALFTSGTVLVALIALAALHKRIWPPPVPVAQNAIADLRESARPAVNLPPVETAETANQPSVTPPAINPPPAPQVPVDTASATPAPALTAPAAAATPAKAPKKAKAPKAPRDPNAPSKQEMDAIDSANSAIPLPLAREALLDVGADPQAEAVWLMAINDPDMSPHARKKLIEDLGEDGFAVPKHPTRDELPLIQSRIELIEEIGPDAVDETNANAFQEAYKDLVKMYVQLTN